MGALSHTLVAVALSVSLPPGSAVSLHSCPTARDCGRASGQRLRPRGPFPAPPDAFGAAVRRLKGGFVDVASVSGIAGQILRGFFKGWLRNEARDPVQLILVLASWWDFRQKLKSLQNQTASTFEKVFQKLELFEELAQRGRTSEEGPACGGARRVRTAAGALNNPQYVRRCVEAAATAEARADAAHPDKAAAREARQLLERSLADAPAGETKYFISGNTWWEIDSSPLHGDD